MGTYFFLSKMSVCPFWGLWTDQGNERRSKRLWDPLFSHVKEKEKQKYKYKNQIKNKNHEKHFLKFWLAI